MCARLLLAAACATLCGCGTVSTFVHDPNGAPPRRPFGGAREDLEFLTETTAGEAPLALFALIDLPLSFTADVVTLPWTLRARNRGHTTNPDGEPAP